MAGSHDSPTAVSRIRVANAGEIVTSESKLDNGFSIRWKLLVLANVLTNRTYHDHPSALQSIINVVASVLQFRYLP